MRYPNDPEATPTPVAGARPFPMPPTHSGAIHMAAEKTIPVGQIHIPLPAMLAILAFMLGGVASMTLVWAKSTDPALHLEPTIVTNGGGVAYKNEVKSVRQDFKDALLDEHRATRRMLMQMTFRCQRLPGGGSADLDCKVSYLPEPEH